MGLFWVVVGGDRYILDGRGWWLEVVVGLIWVMAGVGAFILGSGG